MKHIFLTGQIQIGKSTVLNKTLSALGVPYDGFRTYFGIDRRSPNRCLYLSSAHDAACYDEDHVIVRFQNGCPAEIHTDIFDHEGADYIIHAKEHAALIVMDECGSLERNALHFQQTILNALLCDTPILGVIKLDAVGWVDQLRYHPNVELITVDKSNRDDLPPYLAEKLRTSLHCNG